MEWSNEESWRGNLSWTLIDYIRFVQAEILEVAFKSGQECD